jgi:hypothetical protein
MGRSASDDKDQAIAPTFAFESSVMALAFCAGSVPTKRDDNDDDLDNYKDGNDHCLGVACKEEPFDSSLLGTHRESSHESSTPGTCFMSAPEYLFCFSSNRGRAPPCKYLTETF